MDPGPSTSGSQPPAPMLHTWVFDALTEQIAVIDGAGTIIDVNAAWRHFGAENGVAADHIWIGTNYLDALAESASRGDQDAEGAAHGISNVLNGDGVSFELEYPCHSPHEKRWFVMRATRLTRASPPLIAISHSDITTRKLAEERAEYLALHDSLTGIANRRHFDSTLERLFATSRLHQQPVSLISVDIDHFKAFNDEYGHLAGDDCLKRVAQSIGASCRPGDLAARVGGDEFALLLGDTAFEEAQTLAEVIIAAVADLGIVHSQTKRITVSVGVSTVTPSELEDASGEHLVQVADDALYRAKHAGRLLGTLRDSCPS